MSHGVRTETEDEANQALAAVPQVVISDLVPEGRALVPVQTSDRLYIAVRPDAEVKQLVQELNDHIQHAYGTGLVVPYNADGETRPRPTV
ncbi:hypothetical protein [Streptomyces sp. W1SF4]|uniref:hypothetical protein n=1 Tax=Streptomyces sp. W1SF4 TaxID=2305220 RepID=UPI000F6DBBC3|nr:hypothetical protein [Streptomyces sp. W1SF4]AZM91480.1 hypothetical protein D1J60_25845 [Streptomyces sp. W1SF4]